MIVYADIIQKHYGARQQKAAELLITKDAVPIQKTV
jgi:hypothetical protein